MRKYISDDHEHMAMTIEIDEKVGHKRNTLSQTDAANGNRVYLMRDGKVVDSRKWSAQKFCNAVAKLCDTTEPSPLASMPWFYIGWSLEPKDQIAQHDDESGFIIMLIARIAELIFPRMFHIETFILAYLAAEEESAFGEIILTGIASAYHDFGTGMCIHPAGLNNDSARMANMPVDDVKAIWDQFQAFRNDQTEFYANMQLFGESLDRSDAIEEEQSRKRKKQLEDGREFLRKHRPRDIELQTKLREAIAKARLNRTALGNVGDPLIAPMEKALAASEKISTAWDFMK